MRVSKYRAVSRSINTALRKSYTAFSAAPKYGSIYDSVLLCDDSGASSTCCAVLYLKRGLEYT